MRVKTPYGDLVGEELEDADALYLYFSDMVDDGAKADYAHARNLFANPRAYLKSCTTRHRADELYADGYESDDGVD